MAVTPAGFEANSERVSRSIGPRPPGSRHALWKILVVVGAVFVLVAPNLHARKVHHEKKVPTVDTRGTARTHNDLPLKHQGLNRAAAHDTTVLAQFDFEGGVSADAQGWIGVDRTAQPDTFFHVDDFSGLGGGSFGRLVALEGSQSLWCGARPGADPLLCAYAVLPGYGHNWDQRFESVALPVEGDVTFSYKVRWDSEPNYDFTVVEYMGASESWTKFPVNGGLDYNGIGELTESFVIDSLAAGSNIRLRFRFLSDGAWNDQDGLFDTDGAVIVDSVTVSDARGVVDFQDFEAEAVGALVTNDGDWGADVPAFGGYAALYPALSLPQEDPCTVKMTFLWGFFADPAVENYSCGGFPGQGAVAKGPSSDGYYMRNEIWSPTIQFAGVGSGSEIILTFDVYRDLPLDNLVHYEWHVRSWVGDCPGEWKNRGFVHYGGGKDWLRHSRSVGDLIATGADSIQVALGAVDMCGWWCGIHGTGDCHSHAPLFDNVKLTRVATTGPLWSVRDIDLFQDNFATDGTTTGTVGADMANDIMPNANPKILPGDSIVVTVSEPNVGLGTDPITGCGAAVYAYVAVWPPNQPGKDGRRLEGPEENTWCNAVRWPVVDSTTTPDGRKWYQFRMDSVFTVNGGYVQNKFCFDLNDDLFTPGDTIFFYFSAKDASGITTYFSRFTGSTTSRAEVEAAPMEMTCLPANALSGATDVLYVDDYDQRGAQPYFDAAFEALGITPDRYDVRGPTNVVSNGPGGRVFGVQAQLIPYYRTVIWNSGDVTAGTIGDGNGPSKADDFGMLFNFVEFHDDPGGVGLYISGDNVVEEWVTLIGPYASALQSGYMHFILSNGDHVAQGLPISPLVVGQPGSIFDHFLARDQLIAYGGCPAINNFDVLQATGSSTVEAAYLNDPATGAVLSQQTANFLGYPARVVLSGFSFHEIRDGNTALPAHIEHLQDIMAWLQGGGAVLPTCQVDPTSLDFDSVQVGAFFDTTFVIMNIGTDPLVGSVSAPCPHYSIVKGGAYNLSAGEKDTVAVRFQPTTLGLQNCTIETGDLLCSDVFCAGTGIVLPTTCGVQPDNLVFGVVNVGSVKDTTFVITNTGGGFLIGSVSEPCSLYSIVSGGAYNLGPGLSDTVTVRFAPASVGSVLCTVDTGDSTCSDVALIGIGQIPCVVTPTTIDFGTIGEGSTKDTTFTVKNIGSAGVLAGTVSETCADFSFVPPGDIPYSLAVGESLLVSVRFEPTSADTHACMIETGDAACTDVALTGITIPCYSILYVDSIAAGTEDGSSWENAFTRLQDALAAAWLCPATTEIWVAARTYKPTDSTDRTATFQLQDSLAIYGGFDGMELSRSQRDWATNITILSGDIGVIDVGSDNSYHVVTGTGTNATAVLDGFTITKGWATGAGDDEKNGGGMYSNGGTGPTVANVTFLENAASVRGGGMCNITSSPSVFNVIFSRNDAQYGGGMYNLDNSPTIVNVVFSKNTGTVGGGLCNNGMIGNPPIVNVTFSGDSAMWGGAIYNENSNPLLVNAILWDDTATTGADEIDNQTSAPTISYSLVEGGLPPGSIDGGHNIYTDPLFIGAPSNLRLDVGSPAIDAGDDAAPNLPATDLDGNPRIVGDAVDMGAYEDAWGSIPKTVVTPSSFHFDRIPVGSWRDTTFVIKNIGGGTLDVNVSQPCSLYSITLGGGTFSLAHDESIVVDIRFAPTVSGIHRCLIETGASVYGRLVFIAFDQTGLHILDARDPGSPSVIGTYDTGWAHDVFVMDGIAFVADDVSGLQIIDVSDPTSPTLLGTYDTPGSAWDVTVSGDYAFVADYTSGLQVIDISDPTSPTLTGTYNASGQAYGVTVSGDYSFVAAGTWGLQVFDISNPANPTFLGSYNTPSSARDVTVSGVYALVADYSSGLQVIDISNPATPTLLGTYDTPDKANGVDVSGDYALVADGVSGILAIDISDPATPKLLETRDTPGNARSVTISEDYAYVGDANFGLQVFDVFEPNHPDSVANYDAPGAASGVAVVAGADVACAGYAGYEYALIDSVVDVPGDQGGQVRIRLTRSIYDFVEETQLPIAMYTVYRRDDSAAAAAAIGELDQKRGTGSRPAEVDAAIERGELPDWPIVERDGRLFVTSTPQLASNGLPPGNWEIVYGFGAAQQQNYVAVAPTTADSSQSGKSYEYFVITAHTTTPSIWFTSPIDSGYSVDNIAPGVPQAFVVAYNTGGGNQLSWDPAPEPDFQYYRVFRGSDENFTPDSTNAVHETASPGWTDPDYDDGTVHYKVTAVDHSGNESGAAGPGTVTAATEPAVPNVFALYQNVPNPFNPTTVIRYDVPAGGGRVTLRIYDVAGRLVRTLVDAVEGPGEKRITWNGRNNGGSGVATEIYFYRMTGPGFTKTRKMVLLQ
jgi:hypothetical protein